MKTANNPLDFKMQAENIIAELAVDFLKEAQKQLEQLQEMILQLEKLSVTEAKNLMQQDFFRIVHDLKGQGSTFGYPLLTETANLMCRYVEKQNIFAERELTKIKVLLQAMQTVILKEIVTPSSKEITQLIKEANV